MEEVLIPIVEVKGHKYFIVDQDLSRGDRRSDGPALANFFDVEGGSINVNNVRGSQRLKTKSEASPVGNVVPPAGILTEALPERTQDASTLQHVRNEEPGSTPKVISGRKQGHGDGYVTELPNFTLRVPKAGIRCSGRNDTTRLLWLHEYYVVHEGSRSKGHNYIYEAVQFLLGEHIPVGEVDNMTDRMRKSVWVQGRCYLPAEHVRHFSKRTKGYMFHTELNDGDGRTALLGSCPEVVRIDNWLTWHQMRCVSTVVPRVVHAQDVQTRRVHVSGRENHFVCGVSASQDFGTQIFTLSLLQRCSFSMYPEEILGMEINSPSMMWEHIDEIFHKIRLCMSSGRQGTTSASFTLPVLCTVFDFWQVPFCYYCKVWVPR
jgi:hypothetical protein